MNPPPTSPGSKAHPTQKAHLSSGGGNEPPCAKHSIMYIILFINNLSNISIHKC